MKDLLKLINYVKHLQDMCSKNTCERATQKQSTSKEKDIKLLIIFSEIPCTQILHHVTTSQMNFDKIQITAFCKTVEQGISEQTLVIKVNQSELK